MLDEYLTRRNDYNTLAGIYRGLVEADPEDVESYGKLSVCYLKLGMYKEAMAASQKVVDKGRADAATYRRMALIAGEEGDFDERVRFLELALKLEPNSRCHHNRSGQDLRAG
jgi:tetratricopeptide (TPR) repeat protein